MIKGQVVGSTKMYNQLIFYLTRKISLLVKLDILYDCFDGSFTTIKYWSYYYYYIQSTRADIRGVHGLGATESPVAIQPTLLFPIPFNVWDPCKAFGTP